MTRLVLHVGLAKTGTTAFQAFLSANRRQLAAAGLHFAEMLRGPNHAQLAAAFSTRITGVSRAMGVHALDDRIKLRQHLARKLRRADRAPAWIASSEHISTMLRRPDNIVDLAGFLHEFFDDVLVLIAVRRADFWVPSAYVEAVKAGNTRRLDEQFVQQRSYLLHHRKMLRRWSAAFGARQVRIVPFLETDKDAPAALPARLLSVAGVPVEAVTGLPTPPHVRNEALSAEAVEVLRLINAQLCDDKPTRDPRTRRKATEMLRKRWPGDPPALTPEAAVALHERGWVRTGVGSTRFAAGDGWDVWESQPDAPTCSPVDVRPRDVALATKLLRRDGVVQSRWTAGPVDAARRLVARARGR
jgi:hypothetical protein